MDALIKDGKLYPLTTIRCEGMWGSGSVVYFTGDGHAGVQLDGEIRVDEYPAEYLGLGEEASEALALLAA